MEFEDKRVAKRVADMLNGQVRKDTWLLSVSNCAGKGDAAMMNVCFFLGLLVCKLLPCVLHSADPLPDLPIVQPIGGKKRSAYFYDLWCLKYLSKFK